jgi:hypothetical protein
LLSRRSRKEHRIIALSTDDLYLICNLGFHGSAALSAVARHSTKFRHGVKFDKIEDLININTYHPCIIREAIEVVKHLNYNREDRYKLS